MLAHCVRCNTKRVIKNASFLITRNSKVAKKGVRPVYGCKMFRMVKILDDA